MSWITFAAVCSSPKPLTCSSVHFLMPPWLICRFDLKHCLMAWLTPSGPKYWVDLPLDIWKISPSILLWVMPYSLANLFIRLWNSFLPKTNLQGRAEYWRSDSGQHLMNASLVTMIPWQKSIQKFSLLQFYSCTVHLRDSLQIGFLLPVILGNFPFLGKSKAYITKLRSV